MAQLHSCMSGDEFVRCSAGSTTQAPSIICEELGIILPDVGPYAPPKGKRLTREEILKYGKVVFATMSPEQQERARYYAHRGDIPEVDCKP